MSQDQNQAIKNALALSIGRKSFVVALLLWFFLGALGVHRMYLGKVASGFVMALLSIIGWMTIAVFVGVIPLLIVFVWWVFDLITIIRSVQAHNSTYEQLRK